MIGMVQFVLEHWLRLLEVGGTFFLSGLLVYLYFQQYKILKLEHQPSVEVADYELENTANIYLSNYGKGLARDLELVSVLDFEGTDNIAPDAGAAPLRRESTDQEATRLERSIKPHDERIWFQTDPTFAIWDKKHGTQHRGDMASIAARLADENIDTARFQLFVQYTDELGNVEHESVLWPVREFEVESGISLRDAYSRGATFHIDLLDESLEDRLSTPSKFEKLWDRVRL